MNFVVDAGNSLSKIGVFDGEGLVRKEMFSSREDLKSYLSTHPCGNILVSSVSESADAIASWAAASGKKMVLHAGLRLPLQIRYETPATLGVDRIAAACGAWNIFPGQHSLTIDLGTCINYEFVHADGSYRGGAISPGVNMRFEAMHRHTARLPLAPATDATPLTGISTLTCLQSGVMNGVLGEIKAIMSRYADEYPGIRVILCGGDAHF